MVMFDVLSHSRPCDTPASEDLHGTGVNAPSESNEDMAHLNSVGGGELGRARCLHFE